MNENQTDYFRSKVINGWHLFWLITLPITGSVVISMMRIEMDNARAVSSMIELAVRCAVPLLFVAFAASSVNVLFPSSLGRWMLRNRKFIGLSFAAAMAWQLFFILWMVTQYTEYYVEQVYALSDVIEGIGGYLLLIAMVLTSFRFGRSRLSAKQWKNLHTVGIYWLWIYAWIAYWFHMYYYDRDPLLIDYVYYWMGFLAWGMRMAAWTKKRWPNAGLEVNSLPFLLPGIAAIAIGLFGVAFGSPWGKQIYQIGYNDAVLQPIGVYTPFFPWVPFLPCLLIMLGAILILRSGGATRLRPGLIPGG